MAKHHKGIDWWLVKIEDNGNRVLVADKNERNPSFYWGRQHYIWWAQKEHAKIIWKTLFILQQDRCIWFLNFDVGLGFESISLINLLYVKLPLHYNISVVTIWCIKSRFFQNITPYLS